MGQGRVMKKLFGIVIFCLSQFAVASDVFDNDKPKPFNLADPLAANASIAGYPIWQGEGKWQLVDIVRSDSTGDSVVPVPLGRVHLFQTEHKKFVALMEVSVNLADRSGLRWLGEPCKRDDMLYKADIGKSIWQDNCVTINHITNFPGNPSGKRAELYALITAQGIEFPPTVLRIDWTRNGLDGNFYRVSLNINPELLGFKRETELNWGRNPWNKTMSFKNPEKKQFIDALGAWSLRFAQQMDAALDKQPAAFLSIPSWRSGLVPVSN